MIELEPDSSYALFGAEVMFKRLKALTQESGGVRQAEDIEYIHRMRVASRRLRAVLDLFKDTLPRKKFVEWEKQVRCLTRALGAVRDTDVQTVALDECLGRVTEPRNRPGIERLKLRLQQRRARLQAEVVKALDGWEASSLANDMTQSMHRTVVQARLNQIAPVSPLVFQLAHSHISMRLEEFLAYEYCVHQPELMDELHTMRITAKRLRYTLEIFVPLYEEELKEPLKTIREAQDLLGEIHDCDMWAQYMPHYIDKERARAVEYFGNGRAFSRLETGLHYFQKDREDRRNERYDEFVRFWERTNEQAVWAQMRLHLQARLTPVQPPSILSLPNPENWA